MQGTHSVVDVNIFGLQHPEHTLLQHPFRNKEKKDLSALILSLSIKSWHRQRVFTGYHGRTPDLANKNTEYPVTFQLQINGEWRVLFLSVSIAHAISGHFYGKSYLLFI